MSEILVNIERALDVVSELCDGRRKWTMTIPARPDDDPDLVISGALGGAKAEIERLTRELEEARERERRMWTVLHSVEWQGREDDDGWRQCPECWAWGSEGHTPDCALRAILATLPAEGGGDGG